MRFSPGWALPTKRPTKRLDNRPRKCDQCGKKIGAEREPRGIIDAVGNRNGPLETEKRAKRSMKGYDSTRDKLIAINRNTLSLFQTARTIPSITSRPFETWENAAGSLEEQLAEGLLRVAVVGPIKSGKSTVINALLGGDYLRRGAGVVTSIVTRVRAGDCMSAVLDFKTWEQVNDEIRRSMVLFPSTQARTLETRFDIRVKREREELLRALGSLGPQHLVTEDARNVNAVLIGSYLHGYRRVKELMGPELGSYVYEGESFRAYREFVGNEELAIYLKDLQVRLPLDGRLETDVEIADCQGVDSPNPLHFAMIQDYLLRTHLVVYVVSSRTGLRRADMRFLSLMREMGLLENVVFVINCDFDEHGDLADLQRLVQKTAQEIALIRPEPEVFAFSALHNLFAAARGDLPEKERARFQAWEAETALREFSGKETERFEHYLHRRLTRDRFALLLKNHVERLGIMVSGVRNWVRIHRGLLDKDTDHARELLAGLHREQEGMVQIRSMIRDTLAGVLQKGRRELGQDVDRFFDVRHGKVMQELRRFVRSFSFVPASEMAEGPVPFSTLLYMAFHELRHDLEGFMTESINPQIIRFLRAEEEKVGRMFENVAQPYSRLVRDAERRYAGTVQGLGIELEDRPVEAPEPVDMDTLRKLTGLTAPSLASTMRYTARIRTEAVLRLGLYNLVTAVGKLLKRPGGGRKEAEIRALQRAVGRMKQETERSLAHELTDYRENLKFQYLFVLAGRVSALVNDRLLDRFELFTSGAAETLQLIGVDRTGKEGVAAVLEQMERTCDRIATQLEMVRQDMQ